MATKPATTTTNHEAEKPATNPTNLMVQTKDLYLGENIGRDQTLGIKGHTEDSIRRLSFSIKEVGYVIQPITIGPKGYRDDNHKETPEDKYPILAGVGRFLAVNRLAMENPHDRRWKSIPARMQGEVDTKQAELISLHENAVRFSPTSLGWSDGMARLSYMGKTDQQIAEMYNITPAEVSSYGLLRQLSPAFRNLLNDSETNSGIWVDAKRKDGQIADDVERDHAGKPIKYKKLTATFCMRLVRLVRQYLKATKQENMADEDKFALMAPVYAHWDSTGEWSLASLEAMVKAVKTPPTVQTTPTDESQPTAEPGVEGSGANAPSATPPATPGNGKDKGAGRADQSGDPKENIPAAKPKTALEAMEEKKNNPPANEEGFNTTGAMKWFADLLLERDNESAKALGHALGEARWIYSQKSKVFMPKESEKVLQAIAMVFPVAATANN